jgi:hypothetical protein
MNRTDKIAFFRKKNNEGIEKSGNPWYPNKVQSARKRRPFLKGGTSFGNRV